jgi:hypothetical protein
MEDRQYANQVTKYLKRNKKTKDALVGAGVGLAGGAAAGVIAKGIHNKRNGKKFMDGAGKAALIGGGVGTVVGGVGNVALQGHLREKALAKHTASRKESNDSRKEWHKNNLHRQDEEFLAKRTRDKNEKDYKIAKGNRVLKTKALLAERAKTKDSRDAWYKANKERQANDLKVLKAKAERKAKTQATKERNGKIKSYDEQADKHNNSLLVKLRFKAKAKKSDEILADRKAAKNAPKQAAAKPKTGGLVNYFRNKVNTSAPEVNFSHNGNLDDKYL